MVGASPRALGPVKDFSFDCMFWDDRGGGLAGQCSRVNRRVIFPLWGLSSCKPQDPKTSLYYPGSSSLLANPRVPHKPMLA